MGAQDPQDRWQARGAGWKGGSCLSPAFAGAPLIAGSHDAAVLRLDTTSATASWQPSALDCGLPFANQATLTFAPVAAVAAAPSGAPAFVGGPQGVYRSGDGGVHFASASRKEFDDTVTLPQAWLFCSGDHDVRVGSEDEAQRH